MLCHYFSLPSFCSCSNLQDSPFHFTHFPCDAFLSLRQDYQLSEFFLLRLILFCIILSESCSKLLFCASLIYYLVSPQTINKISKTRCGIFPWTTPNGLFYYQHSISTQLKMPQKGHHTAGAVLYFETPSNHNTENRVPRNLHYINKHKGDFQSPIKEISCPFKKGMNIQSTPLSPNTDAVLRLPFLNQLQHTYFSKHLCTKQRQQQS